MKYLWVGVAALFGVAALALWVNISNPAWAYGFVAAAVASLFNHFKPIILKRKSPEEEAKDREAFRQNVIRPDKFHRHPDEH